jgi:hypothetical protein
VNILHYLNKDRINSLGYDTIYLEKPVANFWKNVDWKNILDTPPANLSKTTLQELQLLSRLTLNRTKEEEDLVNRIDVDMDTPFELLCKNYDLSYPKNIIEENYHLLRPILLNLKGMYNRPRPNQLAKYFGLKIDVIVTDTHHTAAYPSGHTVYSKLVSLVLKNKYPQIDQIKLNNIVDNTAKARLLQGVHYPSDNEASIIFANFMFNKLKEIL